MVWERVKVDSYSGYKSNQRPRVVFYQDRRLDIKEILDQWYEGGLDPGRPALYYFKVQTFEHQNYLLRYDPLFDTWFIHDPGWEDSG